MVGIVAHLKVSWDPARTPTCSKIPRLIERSVGMKTNDIVKFQEAFKLRRGLPKSCQANQPGN